MSEITFKEECLITVLVLINYTFKTNINRGFPIVLKNFLPYDEILNIA